MCILTDLHRVTTCSILAKVRPMAVLRHTIAVLLSIGLALSPVVAANALARGPSPHTYHSVIAVPTSMDMNEDCPCCDDHGHCPAALCSLSCVQLGPPSDDPLLTMTGHAAMSGIVAITLDDLARKPPTPPPRV